MNRSWVTYEVDKDRNVTTILNVEPTDFIHSGSDLEGSIADAIVEYMKVHTEIDRAVVTPRNLG